MDDVNLMESTPDKAVLVGDVGVGKTSLFVRFKTGKFPDSPSHNPRDGEYQKKWNINGRDVSMSLYDTAGVERHMSTIPQTYFRWSKVVLLVYSIDDPDSFDSLSNWADNAIGARLGGPLETITCLVGNKCDLDDRMVTEERARQYAEINDIDEDMVFEVSAKDGTGVNEMFDKIALKMKPVAKKSAPPRKQSKQCCS